MDYEDFCYVGYKSILTSKTKIYNIKEIPNNREAENYRTIYRFNKSILGHDSIRDISRDNLFYSDYLFFDIDFPVIEDAKAEVQKFTGFLDNYDIGHETWFSGSKGFHVLVPTSQFSFVPTNDESVLKRMAKGLATNSGITIDEKIYNVSRVIREPFSLHIKTGKRKLPWPEGTEYPESTDYLPNDTLIALYQSVLKTIKKKVNVVGQSTGLASRIFSEAHKGDRNQGLFIRAKQLRERKFHSDDALYLLNKWNQEFCSPPLEEKEFSTTIRSAYRGDVQYIVEESNRNSRILGPKQSLIKIEREFKDYDKTIIKTGYNFFDNYTMGLFPGDMVFWIAVNGNFKTAILSSFAQRMSQNSGKYSVIFSADMPATKLQLRHMAYAEGISIKETLFKIRNGFEFVKFQTAFNKVLVIECPSLSLDELQKDVDFIRNNIGELGLIGIDYLGAMAGCDNDNVQTGKTIHGIHTIIKTTASCPVICLVQGRREYEGRGGGNVEIDKVAGKDCSGIEHKADFLIGSWWHKLPHEPIKYWARFLKARQYDSEGYDHKAYFNLEIIPEQMKLALMTYRKDHPEFNQKATYR